MNAPTDYALLLRASGFRATRGKIQLLKTLHDFEKPVSVTDLAKKLRNTLDKVTLYRSLEELTLKGLVRRVDLEHPHAHYEFVDPHHHHHHLVCRNCGEVEDVFSCSAPRLEKQILKKSKMFAFIQNHAMEFFGICRRCIV